MKPLVNKGTCVKPDWGKTAACDRNIPKAWKIKQTELQRKQSTHYEKKWEGMDFARKFRNQPHKLWRQFRRV